MEIAMNVLVCNIWNITKNPVFTPLDIYRRLLLKCHQNTAPDIYYTYNKLS